jgi:hypothetical protein
MNWINNSKGCIYYYTLLIRPLNQLHGGVVSRQFLLLRNSKVHYHVHKSLSLDPILRQFNPVHTLTPPPSAEDNKAWIYTSTPYTSMAWWLIKYGDNFIFIFTSHPRLGLRCYLIPTGFPIIICKAYISDFPQTCYMPRSFHLPWFYHPN